MRLRGLSDRKIKGLRPALLGVNPRVFPTQLTSRAQPTQRHLFSRHEQVGQKHGDGRDVGDQHEGDQHGDIEGNTASGCSFN